MRTLADKNRFECLAPQNPIIRHAIVVRKAESELQMFQAHSVIEYTKISLLGAAVLGSG